MALDSYTFLYFSIVFIFAPYLGVKWYTVGEFSKVLDFLCLFSSSGGLINFYLEHYMEIFLIYLITICLFMLIYGMRQEVDRVKFVIKFECNECGAKFSKKILLLKHRDTNKFVGRVEAVCPNCRNLLSFYAEFEIQIMARENKLFVASI